MPGQTNQPLQALPINAAWPELLPMSQASKKVVPRLVRSSVGPGLTLTITFAPPSPNPPDERPPSSVLPLSYHRSWDWLYYNSLHAPEPVGWDDWLDELKPVPDCAVGGCVRMGEQRVGYAMCKDHYTHPTLALVGKLFDNKDNLALLTQAAKRHGEVDGQFQRPTFRLSEGELLSHNLSGSTLNLPITYVNGDKWIFRLRLPSPSVPTTQLAIAEMYTQHLAHMLAPTVIPDAACVSWDAKSGNALEAAGLEGIFLKLVPGETLLLTKAKGRARKVVKGIADMFIGFSKKEFGGVGNPLVFCDQYTGYWKQTPRISPAALHTKRIAEAMESVLDAGPASGVDRLVSYLAHLELKDLVETCEDMKQGKCFIKHRDLTRDFIMVSADGAMVIDWDGAYTTTFAEAFAAPPAFLNTETYTTSNDMSRSEKALMKALKARGRTDMADAVANGRKFHRMESAIERKTVPTMREIWLTRTAFQPGASEFPDSLEEWLVETMVKFAGSKALSAFLSSLSNLSKTENSPTTGTFFTNLHGEITAVHKIVKTATAAQTDHSAAKDCLGQVTSLSGLWDSEVAAEVSMGDMDLVGFDWVLQEACDRVSALLPRPKNKRRREGSQNPGEKVRSSSKKRAKKK